MEVSKTIEIGRFILFLNDKDAPGWGNMAFSSDDVMKIYRWMDAKLSGNNKAVILDTELNETTTIVTDPPTPFINYDPRLIVVNARVWVVMDGLPEGIVNSVNGDDITITCAEGDITVSRTQCVMSFGDSASEISR